MTRRLLPTHPVVSVEALQGCVESVSSALDRARSGRVLRSLVLLGLLASVSGCSGDDGTSAGSGDPAGTGGDTTIGTGGGSTDGSTGGSGFGTGGSGFGTGGSGFGTGGSGLGTGGVPGDGSGGDSGDGSGGSDGNPGSPGCGSSTAPQSGKHSINVNGVNREYYLDIPANYDPNSPYPIVFGWHWRGGNAGQVANGQDASFGAYYGLKALANDTAIFVAPEGLSSGGETGWPDTNGRDIAFAKAMLDRFESELCVDTSRIFSTGFSYGGMFSFAVACSLGDRFRAIAPISGSLWSGCGEGNTPVAVLGMHGTGDEVVPPQFGREGRDRFLSRNGCSSTTTNVQPDGCVRYEGCAEGNPVVWCEYSGGHWPPNYAPTATWDFFSSF